DHSVGRDRARDHAFLPRPSAEEDQPARGLPLVARLDASQGGTARPSRGSEQFAGQVNRMFDRIAGVYDRMNTVMTVGLDRSWRRRAADRAELAPGDAALDV